MTMAPKAATIIAEGEVFQLSKTGDLKATPADYDQVIRAKTATLFQAAAEVGAMAGGADEISIRLMPDVVQRARRYDSGW